MQIIAKEHVMQGIFRRAIWLGSVTLGVLQRQSKSHREGALVRAAKKGDRTAFDVIMSLHSASLKRFISRRVGSDDREDVLQDTWIAVWEYLPKFDGSSQLRTWIYSICFHKIQDHWRREQCRPPSEAVVDAEGAAAYIPPEFASIELREAIREMWEACSPDQRELLRMYYSDGLTLNEISLVLGQNLNTVKYRFYRAHELAARLLPVAENEALLSREATA